MKINISLLGNPNSGKSTLFNVLTGLNQKTGNFPGVTVEKRTGTSNFIYGGRDYSLSLTDLPGTYSLFPKSLDESITAKAILSPEENSKPDLILIIADASNLKRSLFIATQVNDLGLPAILVLNMIDQAKKQGTKINIEKLSKTISMPVVACNSRKKEGIEDLEKEIALFDFNKKKENPDCSAFFLHASEEDQQKDTLARFNLINNILQESVEVKFPFSADPQTRKIDMVLTHRIWGLGIFFVVMFTVFQSIFFLAEYPMQWIESFFAFNTEWVSEHMPKNEFTDLLANGILSGLGGVIMFIPQIAILFFFISLMEDTGYLARVSFIMDRVMRNFGLNGKSVIPLLSGMACAIPAIMGTRTIANWKERMITIFVTPFMSCSARLPVYTLAISLVIPEYQVLGIINLQGLVLMGLYLLGFITALLAAWVLKMILKAREKSYFIMEMPVYRLPRWNSVGLYILDKVKVFIWDAGKMILLISIILWFLASHSMPGTFDRIEKHYTSEVTAGKLSSVEAERLMASEKLENSFAGKIGKLMEPAIKPIGFDWKLGIAVVTSFAAREVFVGTMATIYNVGNPDDRSTLREQMSKQVTPTGEKVYTLATGISLMLFYALAMQCMSTFAVVYRETRSWKWPTLQLISMTLLAYLACLVTYQSMT